jgi:hypothetical protein
MQIKKDSTDQTVYFHLRDDDDGLSKTGLVYNSAGAIASYIRTRGTRTAISLATLAAADSAHSDGGFKEVDGTNAKGLYRLDVPDAAFATGVDEVIIHIGFTDAFEESLAVELVDPDRLLLLDTTIATLASQTSFTLTAGSADDDAYNNCTIVIEDASTATQKAVGIISNYVGSSKTITLLYDPAIFTMAATDKIYILAENAIKSMVANRQLDVASDGSIHPTVFAIANQIWDELQSGHTDSGSFGRYLDTAITTIAAAIGSGLLSCTWTQKDGQGNPMDNVQIWISTDEGGANVVAGAIYTDTAGEATFMLDAGTYYVWREKGGYNFTNPQTWTVS